MSSYQEIGESYNRLQIVLGQLLKGHDTKFTIPRDNDLMVLETSSDSVGFTLVNGDSQIVFNSAYSTFKNLYREKHNIWKERNLSFVVCRSDVTTSEEAFFNLLEMDIYFCRKYVVHFSKDENRLERELLRLPFLPLIEGKLGGVVRPPSAQTLLQSIGISASLSRQIIVPSERSASRIVEEITIQKEQLPDIIGTAVPPVQQDLKSTERSRIKNIIIESFRAYNKKQEFDVDADIVVLYGPNGLGKTSFFDAIDYVCTGRIGRLCHRNMTQESFIDLTRHLSNSNSNGSVLMEISQGTSTFNVQRNINDWGSAYIDGDKFDRANTLQFITSAQWGEKKERIENLERLFRATHLFSQTSPELLIEFEKDSTLSADLVSRTLALEDYASGNKKLQAISEILKVNMKKENDHLDALKLQLKAVQDRINELPSSQKTVQAGQQFKKMAADLVMKIRTDTRVNIEETEATVESVREWRAVIEAELKNGRDRLLKLQNLESGYTQFEKNTKDKKAKLEILIKFDAEILKHETDRMQLEEAKKKILGEITEKKTILSKANAKLDAYTELKGLQDFANLTRASLQQWNQELMRIEKGTQEVSSKMQQLHPTYEQLKAQKKELQETLEIKSQRIQTLNKIKDGLAIWEVTKKEIAELQELVLTTNLYIEKNAGIINEQKRLIELRAGELEDCEQQYNKLTSSQAELTRFLDEIELYVKDGVCPTCGVDHKTKMNLIERIRAQKETRPIYIEELAENCRKLRKTIEEINAYITIINREQESKSKELIELSRKIVDKQKLVTEFEQLIEQSNINVDDQEIPKIINRLLTEEMVFFQVHQNELVKIKTDEDDIVKKIKEFEKKQFQEAEARKRANDAIEPLEQQMRVLRSKTEVLNLSLDMNLNEITSEQKMWTISKGEAEKQLATLISQEESLVTDITKVGVLSKEVQANAETVRKENKYLEKEVLLYEEMAAGVIKSDALESSHIIKERKQTLEYIEVLERLILQALTLERALDSAQHSAMLSELESKAQAMITQGKEIEKRISRISTVKKWFSQISDILNKYNSEVVENHVLAFGPLTSLLQKRLRAVYGFGNINVSVK